MTSTVVFAVMACLVGFVCLFPRFRRRKLCRNNEHLGQETPSIEVPNTPFIGGHEDLQSTGRNEHDRDMIQPMDPVRHLALEKEEPTTSWPITLGPENAAGRHVLPVPILCQCNQATWRNWREMRKQNRRTAIGRLPDELLMMIMKEVEQDPIDLYVLRQTAHLFARLFGDLSFCNLHGHEPEPKRLPLTPWRFDRVGVDKSGSRVYFRFGDYTPFVGDNAEEALFRRLFLTELCTQCRLRITSGERDRRLERLEKTEKYCTGCQREHSHMLFSARQRAASKKSRPVCVVHEGSIKICAHHSIKHRQIREWVQNAELKNQLVWQCQHCFSDLELPTLPVSISHSRDGTHQPRLSVSDYWPRCRPEGPLSLRLLKTCDLPIFSVSGLASDVISGAMVKDALEAAQLRYGDLTCPHLRFNDGQLLRELNCLQFPCLMKGLAELIRKEEPDPAKRQSAAAAVQVKCPEFHKMMPKEDMDKFNHLPTYDSLLPRYPHRVCCRLCTAEYKWVRRGDCFWVSFRQKFPTCRTTPYSDRFKHRYDGDLVDYIDPASYGHEEDIDLKHITWCPEPTCDNWKRGDTCHTLARRRMSGYSDRCCDTP
ncbi:hypothetical protein QBC37DRAFT_400852 [Rhypophila decipiens]|uniref:F-box domain-containing protein n=1 Tax=Rhypophila decipiens TaxID=261697 RepID=A0AAN7B7H2_9PEZI|nr:hypothetical protein QBC37DRAFT_400852 [Rhypophila decipiens]